MMKGSLFALVAVIVVLGCKDDLPEPQPQQIEGIRNAVQVGDLLFGGRVTEAALAEFASGGYRTVLNTRGVEELEWDEKAVVESLGMAYVSIPMPYPIVAISDDQVSKLNDLLEHGERPMVLHCSSGNRVSGLWALWLIEYKGVDPEEALRLAERTGMSRIRPNVEERLAKKLSK